MLPWLATFLALLAFVIVGAALMWAWCSRRAWCPYYLRRQLDSWHRQVKKKNDERKRKQENVLPFREPKDPDDEAS
jgi:hypothetical protein